MTLALNITHWTAVADFTTLLPAGGMAMLIDPTPVFDDACDMYCDFRGKNGGIEARVFQMDFAGGKLVDVTAEADARIAKWLTDSARELPAWMEYAA